MRTLNVRLFLGLIVGLVIAGVAVYWVHGHQVRRNASVFLEEAQRAKEEGDLRAAVHNFEWYVELVPNDANALADYGSLLADLSVNEPAYSTFEKVLRLDPNRIDIRRRIVSVAIQLGRYTDAREHLEQYLLKDAPEDAELLFLLGTCQEAVREYEPAASSFRRAIKANPHKLESYPRLADLLRHRFGAAVEADTWMKKLVDSNPKSCQAHVYRGNYLRDNAKSSGKWEAAIDAAMEEAVAGLALSLDDADALLLAAECSMSKKDLDKAHEYARRAAELYPRYVAVFLTLADIELQSGKRREAIDWLRRGLEKNPRQADLLWNLAIMLVDELKADEAGAILEQLRAGRYREPLVGYLEARVELLHGRWLAASRLFEQFRAELMPWPDLLKQVDFCSGICYEQLGEPDLQLTAYRRAASVDPFWAPPRVGIATGLLAMGRTEEAFQEYQQIMTLRSAPAEAHVQLARLAILRNLTRNREERDWSEVQRLLDRAEQAAPESTAVPILRAEMLFAQNRVADTLQLLLNACKKRPKEAELWVALVSLAERQRNWKQAEKYLAEAEERFGHSVPVRLARARYYVLHAADGERSKIPQLAEGDEKLSEAEKLELWAGLATVSLQIGDYAQARQYYEKLCKQRPHHLATRMILFDLALRAQDAAGLEENLEEIQRITGNSPLWLYGRAVYLTLRAGKDGGESLKQALKCLSDARVLRPEWSRLPLLAAKIDDMRGNYDLAVEEYIQAIDLGDRSPTAIRRVVDLLCERRRYLEADRVIRRLEEQIIPFSNQIGRVASEIALRLADFERAQRMARQAAAHSDNYRDHVWLGEVLSIVGQRARAGNRNDEADALLREAEQELRHAITLAEESPVPWLALVQFLHRIKQSNKAEQVVETAKEKIAAADAPLAIAQCYEALGHRELAAAQYKEALTNAPNDVLVIRQVAGFCLRTGNAQEGEALLKRLISGNVKIGKGDLMWARRNMAVTLLSRGGYENLQKALSLVRQNLEVDAVSLQDQRVKLLMLASFPGRQEQREAVKTLETLLQTQQSASPEERFLLAELYLAADDLAGFRQHMQRLLASEPDNPRYVAAYARVLLDRKEASEAQLWIERLEKIAPGELSTLSLQAEGTLQRGDADKAIAILKSYLKMPDANPDGPATRLHVVAANLERLGVRLRQSKNENAAKPFFTEAEAMYRELASKKPEKEIGLVRFLAQRGRFDEALSTADRAWKNADPAETAQALAAVLGASVANKEQIKRAEDILLLAVDERQRPVSLLLVMADLLSFRGECDKAETFYREILTKDRDNVLALNNLAMMLVVQNKQLPEAEQLMNQAVKVAGPRANLLDTRALVYLAMNQPDKALDDLDWAVNEAPGPIVHFHRARACYQLGQEDAARQALKEAYTLGLKPELLHPLERAALRNLRAALK